MEGPVKDTESYRDSIATVDQEGKRLWIYPKMPKGWYYNVRKYFSYFLLLLLFGLPLIKVGGEPLLLFNILERRFIIFGLYFGPQDFYIFVFGMLIFIVFIALFTVVFGRLFCGWICPQTIFMEMVFRRIEYWIEGDANAQRRLNKAEWNSDKIIKKVGKQLLFFGIAVLISNTFLAYIIGVEEVWKIATEPVVQHLGGFAAMIIFSFAFYFVFSVLREQVCVTICPYGRLQSVLLDKDSIAVYYDFERGEPRGKITKKKKTPIKKEKPPCLNPCAACRNGAACKKEITFPDPILEMQQQLGDCIDCKLCVQVCPTGIDIRDGVQLECVNCTACMDACDEVMEKIGRPIELIRYDSYNGIAKGKKKLFTPRVMAYSVVLLVLVFAEGFLLTSRSNVETLLLRTPGMLYQEAADDHISNLYNYQIINKTGEDFPVEFRLSTEYGRIRMVGEKPVVLKNSQSEGALFIDLPKEKIKGRKSQLKIELYSNGELIDKVKTNFLGPIDSGG